MTTQAKNNVLFPAIAAAPRMARTALGLLGFSLIAACSSSDFEPTDGAGGQGGGALGGAAGASAGSDAGGAAGSSTGGVGGAAALANGAACETASECQSANCVDGFCCDGSCSGACESCNTPGSVGSCTAAAEKTDPDGECAPFLCGSSGCESACNKDEDCASGACLHRQCL